MAFLPVINYQNAFHLIGNCLLKKSKEEIFDLVKISIWHEILVLKKSNFIDPHIFNCPALPNWPNFFLIRFPVIFSMIDIKISAQRAGIVI